MARRFNSILETIGRTPVIKLERLAPAGVNLYVKVEAFNPMGSIKDRLALGIIEEAERSGRLHPGQTVVEATSGNTGIGLAMVCARKGYPLVVVMAENFSVERRRLMRFLGAKVVLTPASAMGTGMLDKARELAETHGWFLCRQFENEANAAIHSRTTAREIVEDFEGQRLDYWVTGAGTGGTLKGVARVLAKERPETRVIVCEPDNSPVLAGGVAQQRRADGSPLESHPGFRPHVVQGWSPDFVPKLTEDAVEAGLIAQIVPVSGKEALRLARELARKEGIFTGISGGATLAGALQVCNAAPAGSMVLCMLPDTGERYLSTPLFEDIAEEMSEEELALSRSTASARFDSTPVPAAEKMAESGPSVSQAAAFVDQVVNDLDTPVVVFALEWCEFSWSVRRMFARYGIAYRCIDLDSVEYQRDELGNRIRGALIARTGMPTIPQIFVGGEFMGGCTETFDALREGRLQGMLEHCGVDYDRSVKIDPYSFFPRWLQPRQP